MIGDSMVPSTGSIRKVVRAATALTDERSTAVLRDVRTICVPTRSASVLFFGDRIVIQ